MHGVKFPRWSEDIRSERRTLMHLPVTADRMSRLKIGAVFEINAKEWPHLGRKYARVIHREIVNFDDWSDSDVQKLNLITNGAVGSVAQWEIYRQRWKAVHGPPPAEVIRIEFEYVAPPLMPEECIAA